MRTSTACKRYGSRASPKTSYSSPPARMCRRRATSSTSPEKKCQACKSSSHTAKRVVAHVSLVEIDLFFPELSLLRATVSWSVLRVQMYTARACCRHRRYRWLAVLDPPRRPSPRSCPCFCPPSRPASALKQRIHGLMFSARCRTVYRRSSMFLAILSCPCFLFFPLCFSPSLVSGAGAVSACFYVLSLSLPMWYVSCLCSCLCMSLVCVYVFVSLYVSLSRSLVSASPPPSPPSPPASL